VICASSVTTLTFATLINTTGLFMKYAMVMKYPYLLSVITLLFAPFTASYGQLLVTPTRIAIDALEQDRSVQVYNSGDMPLYLDIELMRVDNPGINPEHKTPIGDIPQPEMIFIPNRITLGPKQERDIKLIPLQSPTQETLYRLYINPVIDIKVVGEAEDKDKVHAPVTISIGYGVLIHHLPPLAAQTRHWQHQCLSKGGLTLTTTGSVHNEFKKLHSDSDPQVTNSLNLYPGTPVTLPVKQLSGEADNETFTLHCD
jgi:P pilus assembly chaperone PapD